MDSLFSKYMYKGNAHEAGYDSMLTAIAFLKLATHLEDGKLPKWKRGRLEDIKLGYASTYTSAVQALFPGRGPNFRNFFNARVNEKTRNFANKTTKPDARTSPTDVSSTQSEDEGLFQMYQKPIEQLDGERFAQLSSQPLMQVNEAAVQMNELAVQMNELAGRMKNPLAPVNELAMQMNELTMQMNELATPMGLPALADTVSVDVNIKVQHGVLIPRLGSSFWHLYGNKLRVFATIEKTAFFGAVEKPVKIQAMESPAKIKANESSTKTKATVGRSKIQSTESPATVEVSENPVMIKATKKTEHVQVNSNLNTEKMMPTVGQLIYLD